MIYFNEDYITIHKDEDAQCVVMEWKTFATSDKFKMGLNKGLELLEKSKYKNWLADLRKMRVIKIEDQTWSNEEWFPKALKTNIQKMAIVVSEDIFNRTAVNSIMSKVDGSTLDVRYFENKEEAIKWFKK